MKKLLFSILTLLTILTQTSSASAQDVGFQRIAIPAVNPDQRDLSGAIWYPATSNTPPEVVGDNPVFYGEQLGLNAEVQSGQFPLVVLSHGFGGNWRNQGWLAKPLAANGFIVVAINHPGTTSRNLEAALGRRLWERVGDIHHTIDFMTRGAIWFPHINDQNITVVGHSLGGWTAMEVAGARMDPDRMLGDCKDHPVLAACDVVRDFGIAQTRSDQDALAQTYRDQRVSQVVSIDLGLARGFDPKSLADINVPVLLIAAKSDNPKIPHDMETGYLATHLPTQNTSMHLIEQAGHFSFLPLCKPDAIPLLEDEVPGDGIICRDGSENADRDKIHQTTTDLVLDFLAIPKRAASSGL